jgi:hypothetical protein
VHTFNPRDWIQKHLCADLRFPLLGCSQIARRRPRSRRAPARHTHFRHLRPARLSSGSRFASEAASAIARRAPRAAAEGHGTGSAQPPRPAAALALAPGWWRQGGRCHRRPACMHAAQGLIASRSRRLAAQSSIVFRCGAQHFSHCPGRGLFWCDEETCGQSARCRMGRASGPRMVST